MNNPMKNARALLLAMPTADKPSRDDTHERPGDVAKDAARALIDSVHENDPEGVVDAFQLLSRACAMMDEPDEDDTTTPEED